jgi:hypothetical protein
LTTITNAAEAGYNFLNNPGEPSVSYALIGKAAGWTVEAVEILDATDGNPTGEWSVILLKDSEVGSDRRINIADTVAGIATTYHLDGELAEVVQDHPRLLELILR